MLISADNPDLKSNYFGATSYASAEIDVGEYQANSIRKQINLSGKWKAATENSDQWLDVIVPGVFAFEGIVTFKQKFTIPLEFKNFHYKFVALGINYRCSIFINDKFIGNHQGGFTSFSFDIDHSLIHSGQENSIKIIVNNYLDTHHTIPLRHNPISLPNYGGIFREIFLQIVPELTLENINHEVKISSDTNLCYLDLKLNLHHYKLPTSIKNDSIYLDNNLNINVTLNAPEYPEVSLLDINGSVSIDQNIIKLLSFLLP
ncbi:hypothetical protein JW964_13775, partial [candidate division KSB1 bacterium]|nr:hypothetical protein [candidate division KSB1 bacterium]